MLIALTLAADPSRPSRAQDNAPGSAGLAAPTSIQRESARQRLGDAAPDAYRSILREGGPPALVTDALVELGRLRKAADIPLIARHVSALNPNIAATAVDALKGYGRAGLKAVQALDAALIDAKTRKQALELLLMDHVRKACVRDIQVNPYRLDYATRFEELDSVGLPLDELLLKLLREALPDIRSDFESMRYYYFDPYSVRTEAPFIQYGALAVAALVKRKPELLEREMEELKRLQIPDTSWYGGRERSAVATELAVFFARRGHGVLIDKVIGDMQNTTRWGGNEQYTAPIQVKIAALQSQALDEHDAALERIGNAIQSLGLGPNPALGGAHYLRARLLIARGEEGAALNALEEAMESSDRPPVIALVDDAFALLRSERRYRDVLRFCELRQRTLPVTSRPWRKDMQEPDLEEEADPEVEEDE